jgi:PKHD-type hydroxylase
VFAKGGAAMTQHCARFPSSACGIFSRMREKSLGHFQTEALPIGAQYPARLSLWFNSVFAERLEVSIMLLHIPDVLSAEQVKMFRQKLETANWADGRITAGYQSAQAKDNLQLAETDPLARELGAVVLEALSRNSTFFTAALPKRIYPPLFNCYRGGQSFGFHVDNAVRYDRRNGIAEAVRTDISATLFLVDPSEYDGGELVIEDTYGNQQVKLPAGHLVLYPSTSLHRVLPVTRGARIASFFWMQSMVRSDEQRRMLLELDVSIRRLTARLGADAPELVQLTGVYHNLLRQWAEV